MSDNIYDVHKDNYITIYKLQICTGSISFLASLAMAAGIQFSKRALTTPYRRLVYGLCVSDIIQSLSIITGPFAPPADTSHAFWARGNITSCNINGFMFSIGFTAVPMYVLALGVYYLFKLKRKVPDREFTIKIEVWVHSFIIVWHLVTNIAFAFTDNFNPGSDGGMCFLHKYPSRCDIMTNEVGECERGQEVDVIATVFVFGPCALCFMGICYCMGRLVQHAFVLLTLSPSQGEEESIVIINNNSNSENSQEAQVKAPQSLPQVVKTSNDAEDGQVIVEEAKNKIVQESKVVVLGDERLHDTTFVAKESSNKSDSFVFQDDCSTSSEPKITQNRNVTNRSEARHRAATLQELSILYKKEMLTQAISFIGVFFIIYLAPLLFWIKNISDSPISYAMLYFSAVIYPLGGFFNILVHTRSNIAAFRRREGNSNVCWLYAFYAVVTAGGDTPAPRRNSVGPSNNASSSSVKYGVTN